MNFNIQSVKIDIVPRFYEVDSYRIVNHMFYISWLEMGRFAFAEAIDIINDRFFAEMLIFVVSDLKITYKKPVTLNDKVVVETTLSSVKASKMVFSHKVKNKLDNSLFSEASTSVVCLKNGRMLLQIPEWMRDKLLQYIDPSKKAVEQE